MLELLVTLSLLLSQIQTVLAKEALYTPPVTPITLVLPYKTQIQGIIRYYANVYGVDEKLAQDLAEFESNTDPTAHNPDSSAKGIYQFLNGTWHSENCVGEVLSPNDNIACAMRVLSGFNGIRHWTADTHTRAFLIENGYVYCYTSKNDSCYIYK